jgi:hypothetical protein
MGGGVPHSATPAPNAMDARGLLHAIDRSPPEQDACFIEISIKLGVCLHLGLPAVGQLDVEPDS